MAIIAEATFCILQTCRHGISLCASGILRGGFKPPPPKIPKALQNCAKLNPICENC